MTLKNRRVFVSGASGVIGSELVKKLHGEGAVVLAADRKPRPLNFPKNIIYRQGDLNFVTKEELQRFDPEIFFHLAASFERSTETYEFWRENFDDNVKLSHHLISQLKDNPSLKKIIFASSYLIYDQNLYSFKKPQDKPYPLKETDPIYPRNLTGCAKLNHEIELNFIKEFKSKTQVVLARIYRGYGRNSHDVISRWVRALLNNEQIIVYNKQNVFDYIFAEDSAEGLLRLAKSSFNGVVNLGSGKSRRIEEVLRVLKKHFPKMKCKETKPNLLYEASEADMKLYQKIAKWKPTHNLESAILKIINFEKNKKEEGLVKPQNVLVTSISKKVPMVSAIRLAAKKLSADVKVFGGDLDEKCLAYSFVDDFYQMPETKDKNVSQIESFCSKNNIGAIVPSRDGELAFWSKHKNKLEKKGISVMVSDSQSIKITSDKLKFYEFLKKASIAAVQTSSKIEDIKSSKFVVKERFGAGSDSIGLNLNLDEAKEHAKKLKNPIFQPFVLGEEMSVDLYVSRSKKVKGVIARERSLVVKGESQITQTLKDEKLETLCAKAALRLNLYGHIIFQVIKEKNKNFHFIECNARFGGASTASLAAGLDSFYWFLLEASGEDITDYPFVRSKKEIKQIRYPADKVI